MSKGPLNYTTTVEAAKTAAECVAILAQHGANRVAIDYDREREPSGLSFEISTPWGPRQYALPVSVSKAQKALERAYDQRRVERRYTSPEHSRKVAWRVIKDWLEAQLALFEADQADLTEVMLPWMRVESDLTMYGAWRASEQKSLEGSR
jgi:hypothetical protein